MLRGLLNRTVPFTQGAQPDGSNPQGNKWPNLTHTSQTLGEVKGQRGPLGAGQPPRHSAGCRRMGPEEHRGWFNVLFLCFILNFLFSPSSI